MKFKHTVYDHKKKVGFDFGSYGPNSLGIRGRKIELCSELFKGKKNILSSLDHIHSVSETYAVSTI